MTIATTAIRSEPHHEIGSIISRDAEDLLDRWCARALDEQPTASRVYLDVLQNELREFLSAMGRVLQAAEREPRHHRDTAHGHGEQRWDNGWSISELVRDYQILQLVLLEHLEVQLDRPLGYREAMAVGVFVDDAIAASIAAYVGSRDLHQTELERAGADALRDAQARKDDFLALVVHELLRNPVGPIVSASEALAMRLRDADQEVQTALRLIRRQSRQVARILDDLSDITGIARGRLTLRQSVIDVADVLEEAIHATEGLMKEREHQVELTVEGPPLVTKGDPARLVQVLVNVLINAAKYAPTGGQVTITARRHSDRIEVVVRDTGVGIPEDMLTKVFDMYTRGTGPVEISAEGLGIGLALVREIVSLHDGSVTVSSGGQGLGSEFVISIPAYSGTEPVTYPTPQPVRLPS